MKGESFNKGGGGAGREAAVLVVLPVEVRFYISCVKMSRAKRQM